MRSERTSERVKERGDSQRCIVNDYAKVERERALSMFFWNQEPGSSTALSVIVLFWGFCSSVSSINRTFGAKRRLEKVYCCACLKTSAALVFLKGGGRASGCRPCITPDCLSARKEDVGVEKKGIREGRGAGSIIIAVSITPLWSSLRSSNLSLFVRPLRKKKKVCSGGYQVQYILATPHSFSAVAACPVGAFRERGQQP